MYKTGNPVPSSALEDMADNAQTFDALVTKTEGTTTDRNGITRRVFQQVLMDMGFQPLAGSFQTGATITARNQTLYDEVSQVFYAWGGTIPVGGYVVAAGSTPATSGGVGVGVWSDKTDLMLRNELTSGGLTIEQIANISAENVKFYAGTLQEQQFRISAKTYGVPIGGTASAVDKLQELINLGNAIWLDEGDYLIDKTLLYIDGTDIIGPGRLIIKSDSNFTIVPGNFFRNDAVISGSGNVVTDTYKINLKFKVKFEHSSDAKPHYPFRFSGLKNGSIVDLDCECIGSGDVTDTNLPDFYYNNSGVRIYGVYTLTHRLPTNTGGMWIRDVNISGNPSSASKDVIIESGTYIQNDGVDEALAFFNPGGSGALVGCGVKSGVRIKGRGIGLSFLNFTGDSLASSGFDCFAEKCIVECTGLRINQGVIKTSYCAPKLDGVTALITGFDDTVTASGFFGGVVNSNDRADGMRPQLSDCTVYLLASVQPAAEIRGYTGSFASVNCGTKHYGTARFTYAARNNSYIIRGGFHPDAITAGIDACTRVYDVRCLASVPFSNITYLRGLSRAVTQSITLDSNGRATITHNIGATPSFVDAKVIDVSGGTFIYGVDVFSVTTTTFSIRVYTKTTNVNAGAITINIQWKVEQ